MDATPETSLRIKTLAKRMLFGVLLTLLALLLIAAWQVDDWRRDFTTNSAATSPAASDPLLRSIVVDATLEQIESAVADFANDQLRWTTAASERRERSLVISLERSTRWLGFIDDVRVEVDRRGDAAVINVASQSRTGRGDLGQNPRNIRQLNEALRERFPVVGAAGEPSG